MSTQAPSSDPKPEFRVVGKDVERQDGRDKVTGGAKYIADIHLDRVLEARVLRSPYAHARVLHVETSKALASPGVIAVVTGEDTPKRKWGSFQQDQYPIAVDKVRYVGDEVAAVAAVDEATAEEALGLIDVEYEELPAVFDPVEAMEPGAPLIHDDKPGNVALHFKVERGDPDGAMAAADLVLEDWFDSRLQWHASIETTGSVGQFNQGKLTLYMNCATIFMARTRIAWALGLDVSNVRVIQSAVGGAFGGKSCDDNNGMICGLLAMKAGGRPVRLINSRQDDFLATRPRPAMKIWVRMGFKRDGTILAKDIKVITDNGAYCAKGVAMGGVAALRHDAMWLTQNLRSELNVVHTNKVGTGAFRGFGSPDAAFAVDQMIHAGAEALGIDPLEMALKNMPDAGYVSPHGQEMQSCELKACVHQAAELIDWKGKREAKAARREHPHPNPLDSVGGPFAPRAPWEGEGKARGMGLASSVHVSGKRHFGDFDGASCVINVGLDGKVQVWSGEGETGPGATTLFAQIAAEAIGVRYEDVTVSQADTDTTTYTQGSYASRTTYIAGNAVRDGAQQVKQQLLAIASEALDTPPEDLEIVQGVISGKGHQGDDTITVAEAANRALYRRGGRPISAMGTWDPPSVLQDSERYGNESGAYNFCSHAVEVEVDRETGQFTMLNYVAASDAGTVVFPIGAEGQVEGAMAQGIGYAVTEDMVIEGGRPVGANFADYRIPCMKDMPPLTHVFVPSYEPTGPMGAKGIGEIGLDPVAPALASAIHDAVGVRIKSLPITAEKILRALREKEQNAS